MNKTQASLSAKQTGRTILAFVAGLAVLYGASVACRCLAHRRMLDQTVPKLLAEMKRQTAELVRAVEEYKQQSGFFPPANVRPGQSRGVLTPLFYELVGTRHDTALRKFFDPTQKEPIGAAEMEKAFGMRCFSNTLPFPDWPKHFLGNMELSKKELDGTEVFGVGFNESGVIPDDAADDFRISPWRYAANPAEHNPGRFDLWIEMAVQGKHYLIGNWSEGR